MQFTDEQVEAIADALRLANNMATGTSSRAGVGLAVQLVADMLEHGNPEFERQAFLGQVYTTTVTRPDDYEPQPEATTRETQAELLARATYVRMSGSSSAAFALEKDPVRKNQSKHVGDDGKLRYNADGSQVYPGANGIRTRETAAADGAEWAQDVPLADMADSTIEADASAMGDA